MNDFRNANKNKNGIYIFRDCALYIISAIQIINNSNKP